MRYTRAGMERAMKVQEVILRAISKQIRWFEAARILGLSGRQLRRLYYRYRTYGYDGLYDRRKGKPSPRRVPLAVAERIFALYQELCTRRSILILVCGIFTRSCGASTAFW